MIDVDVSRAEKFLSEENLHQAKVTAADALKTVRQQNGEGAEWLGWRSLLDDPNDAILEQLDRLGTAIREEADVFLVCGIGGSYLGARAVIEALSPFFNQEAPEIIYVGHHMSGGYLQELIEYLDTPKVDGEPKSVYCNVISKSGTTLETALSFRKIRNWMGNTYPDSLQQRIICTTSSEGGALNKLIDEYDFQKFVIPDDVGGRFSVLTPVGLFPMAVAGIDIRSLFYGAVTEYEKLENEAEILINYAAVKYALYQKGKQMDVLTSFEPELSGLCGWLQQLLGESEGKKQKGMLPVTASYSTDLHSLGQFMQDGSRTMMETFITVQKSDTSFTVEETESNNDELNYLAGKSFHDINSKARKGTISAHTEGGVPCISVNIEVLNASQVGAFIYFYELFTAVYCYCLGVNPFTQPGVENYKKRMYKLLDK
ncbi:glucose-6-phosphate isomerase [Fodinibius salinus]|uniref:Glucose-6-phosphate isomerase n=1 Tax=Fodinibius salinus TaxID=860790 RepID=A0A5D3YLL3_9BACT|nr:glucose-6-phosphate isomerase [Fodinibius salinus]TYP95065.1 glucose-6-phosphate isomerase [Fodinibius salinus]